MLDMDDLTDLLAASLIVTAIVCTLAFKVFVVYSIIHFAMKYW